MTLQDVVGLLTILSWIMVMVHILVAIRYVRRDQILGSERPYVLMGSFWLLLSIFFFAFYLFLIRSTQ